jgi:hypothetical protein
VQSNLRWRMVLRRQIDCREAAPRRRKCLNSRRIRQATKSSPSHRQFLLPLPTSRIRIPPVIFFLGLESRRLETILSLVLSPVGARNYRRTLSYFLDFVLSFLCMVKWESRWGSALFYIVSIFVDYSIELPL